VCRKLLLYMLSRKLQRLLLRCLQSSSKLKRVTAANSQYWKRFAVVCYSTTHEYLTLVDVIVVIAVLDMHALTSLLTSTKLLDVEPG